MANFFRILKEFIEEKEPEEIKEISTEELLRITGKKEENEKEEKNIRDRVKVGGAKRRKDKIKEAQEIIENEEQESLEGEKIH